MESYIEFEENFIPVTLINGLLCCVDCAIFNPMQPCEACPNNLGRSTK